MTNVSKVDIQKLLGDENIDIIIQNGIDDNLPTRTIRITVVNYILRKLFAKQNKNELDEYPVAGKLIRPVLIRKPKSKHDYGYRKDKEK